MPTKSFIVQVQQQQKEKKTTQKMNDPQKIASNLFRCIIFKEIITF